MKIDLTGATLKRITSKAGKPEEVPTVEIVFTVEASRPLGSLLMFAGHEVDLAIESYQTTFDDLKVTAEAGR